MVNSNIVLLFLLVLVTICDATYCPNHCSGHGICLYNGGICVCNDGWDGGAPDCSYRKLSFPVVLLIYIGAAA